MADFETPIFLKNHSPAEVFALMKQVMPSDIDLSQGGHAYNLTMPTALVIAELCEFVLPEVVKLIFPEWSYGTFLDDHAKSRGIYRRVAVAASGKLTITGVAGTLIKAGSLFSTAAVNDEPSVDYMVLGAARIPESGTVTVNIECTRTGIIGNTQADTIVLVSSKIAGIKGVTNVDPVTGGTEIETDESLIQRILEYDQSLGESFVGSLADYKKWATSVSGVGGATVVPAQDNTGLVTIIITDSNGAPATENLCTSVYNYIMRPDDPYERLAPINALISVEPPATMKISIKATVELTEGYAMESIKTAYMDQLARYLPVALDEKEIKYTRLVAALAATEGVNDFTDLQFGVEENGAVTYGTSNIAIKPYELPAVAAENLILTSGIV